MARGERADPGRAFARARSTLEAARVLRDGAMYPDAVERAWWAVVFSARAALLVAGEEGADGPAMLRNMREAHPAIASAHLADLERLEVLKDRVDWELEPGRVPGDSAAREAVEAAGAFLREVASFLEEQGVVPPG